MYSVAFSPDGHQVLTGSKDETARLWDVAGGQELACFAGHADWVYSVAFSPDGRRALTGSHDRTARLWDVSSGQELACFVGHTSPVMIAFFSPDGSLTVTCDENGRVFFWQVASPDVDRLVGMYIASYPIRAVYWQGARRLILADTGGTQDHPYFYHLALEGM